MKRLALIGLWLTLTSLLGCHRPAFDVGTRLNASLPELAAIDTLMQYRPDSALALLLDEPKDHPYYQLLLSEALYKNDYAQANRQELLSAMAYFDSLDTPFLLARCHYMNGVGYYEMDSVVPACAEYLKALEIMEEHFKERDLVGDKAKFMALTYTRLTDVFSNQYLHEQALLYAQLAISFFHRHECSPWSLARLYEEMGVQNEMIGQTDSALYCYDKSLELLPDTNSVSYRNIETARAFLSYDNGKEPQALLDLLYGFLAQAESENESISRCLSIGEIYFREKLLDSAWVYLNKVFFESESVESKKQTAEWLVEICKVQGKNPEVYFDYLVPFANKEENKSELKSQLTELYSRHLQKSRDITHQRLKKRQLVRLTLVGCILMLLSFTFMFYHRGGKHRLENQMREERRLHEAKQKAIGGRLRESNEALRAERKEKNNLLQEIRMRQEQLKWDSFDLFINEDICQEILRSLEGKHIKREAKNEDYPELWLNRTQLTRLETVVERHFCGFIGILTERDPKISPNEVYQCMLCMMNLKDVQIAALLHIDYSTIKKRSTKIRTALGTEKTLQVYLREWVLEPASTI